jgi:hypothetical protein
MCLLMSVMPLVGVMPLPCCNLIVTVPLGQRLICIARYPKKICTYLDGSVQVIVTGILAATWRPPGGILIAFCCAVATTAKRARNGATKRILSGR